MFQNKKNNKSQPEEAERDIIFKSETGYQRRTQSMAARLVLCFLIFSFVFSLILFPAGKVKAQAKIMVDDIGVWDAVTSVWQEIFENEEVRKLENKAKEIKKDTLLQMLGRTVNSALKKIAFDAATYIGSGGKGQKPLWISESWGVYLKNIGDEAAGEFLETVGKENGILKFNLCKPDLAVKIKIGLGLTDVRRPRKPKCTFNKMKENWEKELSDPKFLSKFQDMFYPASSDLGIALSLQTKIVEDIALKNEEGKNIRLANKGWLNPTDIAGKTKGIPYIGNERMRDSLKGLQDSVNKYTGNSFKEVFSVFINQLALTYITRKLQEWDAPDSTSPTVFNDDLFKNDGLTNEEARLSSGGISGVKRMLKQILRPDFTVRGDYNILIELATCPNPVKAGPTNCVITDDFGQAVTERLTVGEAMEQGYLNPNGVFGFKTNGVEPSYNEGYPYRSMIILRKFRILPVGWELAAQYIKEEPDSIDETKNLGDLAACFDRNDEYGGYYSLWCDGLVDPSWVLKAPLNYCARNGPGPEIISDQIVGAGDRSELAISRNDNYCADEQTCIQENDDGSCQLYGYCAEERRKWKFNGDSCEPKYNTCETFRSRAGKTASYLENTLDYGDCSIDNVGCQWYCEDYEYINGEWNCSESFGDKLYLDKDAEECEAEEDGCSEFIRTKAGIGANLVRNSSFESDGNSDGLADEWTAYPDGSIPDGVVRELSYDSVIGGKSQKIVSGPLANGNSDYGGVIYLAQTRELLTGEPYTVSFYAKKGVGTDNNIIISNQSASGDQSCLSFSADITSEWRRYSNTCVLDAAESGIYFWSSSANEEFFIDAVKLERGEGTDYSDYRGDGLIYEKLLPDYMEDVCYVDAGSDYRLAADAPAECDDFARKCNQDEVGCEQYTSSASGISVPAKADAEDYCPSECVGYDTYIQRETVFDSLKDAYFIPSRAKACGSVAVGCDEFTNLDAVKEGGEGREYYTNLKQCIKPDNPAANCSGFYSWEGSEESGYQLRGFQLQAQLGLNEPEVTEDDSLECMEAIYNLSPSDPAYNPDCRQFYNSDGQISYHLISRSITCSDNCYPYRRTENNIDPEITVQAACGGGDLCDNPAADGDERCWDGAYDVCYYCKAGGTWDTDQSACVYDAIPGEGQKCSAASAGCREYAGNTGNNVIDVLNNDFEGSAQGWEGLGATAAEISNEALTAGGNSLYVSGGTYSASTTLENLINENSSYVISFIAKAASSNVALTVRTDNSVEDSAFSGQADLVAGDWGIYQLNLIQIDYEASSNESIVIEGDGDFYIDNIKLTAISDNYYLIKNSWDTPDSCFADIYGNPAGALYNLGCDEYTDRDDIIYNLRGFSRLCQESAVGCELMINTQNYSDYNGATFNAGDDSEVVVPDDKYIYAVYDRDKECGEDSKGCRRLGDYYEYESDVLLSDVYLKDNPDEYSDTLCRGAEVGCEEWATEEGANYFKDPDSQTCEWRQITGVVADSWGWYKSKIKKCDEDSSGDIDSGSEISVCLGDDDCSGGISCITDENDYECPTDSLKTFGYGGAGGQIKQPTDYIGEYWAGLCPASAAGCSEYIDPISRFPVNILFNGSFSQDINPNDSIADGWSSASNGEQDIELDDNTLYVLSVFGALNTVTVETVDAATTAAIPKLYEFDADSNGLIGLTDSLSISSSAGEKASMLFYTGDDMRNTIVTITALDAGAGNNSEIWLKKAVIDYQVKSELDKETCNGIVNFEDGCVLFNERVQSGGNKAGLIWDADLTNSDGPGISPSTGSSPDENNSNILLKVSPDRACNKWLDCKDLMVVTDAKTSVCNEIGLCDKFNDIGGCDRWVDVDRVYQTYSTEVGLSAISNMSGYVKVGNQVMPPSYPDNNWSYPNDYYPLFSLDTVGLGVNVANGSFEVSGSESAEPSYWDCSDSIDCEVIDNPVMVQEVKACYSQQAGNVCTKYAPEGRNFLSLVGGASAETGNLAPPAEPAYYIKVATGTEYIITAYVNTIRLSSGVGRIIVSQYDDAAALIAVPLIIDLDFKNPWTFKLEKFITTAATTQIKITLTSDDPFGFSGLSGDKVFFDDVKIRPALQAKDDWYTAQSCRLYPRDDSLSCDYYADSGIRYRGDFGYCLEWDRYPGSTDACLLWWSIPGVDQSLSGLNEVCGDGIINRDEDCDCGDIDGDGEGDLSCLNPTGAPADSRYSQYMCINCGWAEGWCGDNKAQPDFGEACDCGNNIPTGNINNDCDYNGENGESVCRSNCLWDDCQFGSVASPIAFFPCVFGHTNSSVVGAPSNSGLGNP